MRRKAPLDLLNHANEFLFPVALLLLALLDALDFLQRIFYVLSHLFIESVSLPLRLLHDHRMVLIMAVVVEE